MIIIRIICSVVGLLRKIHLLIYFGHAFCGREAIVGFFIWLKMHAKPPWVIKILFDLIVCNKREYIQAREKQFLLLNKIQLN